MIMPSKEFKDACSKILLALDNSAESAFNGIVELKSIDSNLYLNVTNGEYFVKICLGQITENFHATINADLFLKLIAQVTSENIEFTCTDSQLIVNANGKYKFPIIFHETEILNLTEIDIQNPTVNFKVSSEILHSILLYNSKELSKIPKNNRIAVNELQKMYYIDQEGAITFYNGAVVNKFQLAQPVKLLLKERLVKLFKLFQNTEVDFTLAYDPIASNMVQPKVKFATPEIELVAKLNLDDSQLNKMPTKAIRERAFNDYPYAISISRTNLLSAVKRLMLFANTKLTLSGKSYGYIYFYKDHCSISDYSKDNIEDVPYANELSTVSDEFQYEAIIDFVDFKLALEGTTDLYVNVSFGDHKAMVMAKDNIYTVIPEIII